jgi:hypothetical protein
MKGRFLHYAGAALSYFISAGKFQTAYLQASEIRINYTKAFIIACHFIQLGGSHHEKSKI